MGWVKCLLKEFAIALLVVAILLPNFMERLGPVVVGCLLFSDFYYFLILFMVPVCVYVLLPYLLFMF